MNESELDALADKIAERLLQRPNIPPVLVRKRDISYMLGNSGRSTSTDQVINDPTFPPPVCVTEKGYKGGALRMLNDGSTNTMKSRQKSLFLLFENGSV